MSGCDCPPGLCDFCAFMAALRTSADNDPPRDAPQVSGSMGHSAFSPSQDPE